MRVSTKGRYALRMMLDLAVNGNDNYVSLKDVAARQNVSVKYLEQIVSQLTKAGYLHSVRGPQGGYRLARLPRQYTVGDILRATEGSLAPISCLDVSPNPCARAATCSTLYVWEGLYRHVVEYVDGITLEDVVTHEMQRLDDMDKVMDAVGLL